MPPEILALQAKGGLSGPFNYTTFQPNKHGIKEGKMASFQSFHTQDSLPKTLRTQPWHFNAVYLCCYYYNLTLFITFTKTLTTTLNLTLLLILRLWFWVLNVLGMKRLAPRWPGQMSQMYAFKQLFRIFILAKFRPLATNSTHWIDAYRDADHVQLGVYHVFWSKITFGGFV